MCFRALLYKYVRPFQIIYRALCDIDCGEELLLRSVDSVGPESEEDEGIAQEMAEGKACILYTLITLMAFSLSPRGRPCPPSPLPPV